MKDFLLSEAASSVGPFLSPRRVFLGLAFFVAMILVDLGIDLAEGNFTHMSGEIIVLIVSVFVMASVSRDYKRLSRQRSELGKQLASTQAQAEEWRREAQEALHKLGSAIDRQFGAWAFSEAEKEIGFYILKGLSLKEIASLRGTSERTVRQQAQEVYRKPSVDGRATFAAFFLADLLAPGPQGPARKTA